MKNLNKKSKSVKILPLGGLDAIGRNMTLFEYDDEIIIVDCGIMFPGIDMPGIDFIIPDFSYVVENKHKVKALLLTHGHEDHIGAVSHLLAEVNVPIYGTKLTIGLINSRLEEKSLPFKPVLNEISARDMETIGKFQVEFLRVNHSIVDGVALAIKTPVGTIIHTGDFKIDFSPVDDKVMDFHAFSRLGEEGVLLLMSDSTNAERPGYTGSENMLQKKLIEIFGAAKGRIIVATFASNINRIQQVLDAAKKYNRKVVVSGTSMIKNIEIAKRLGYLKYNEDLIVEPEEAKRMQDKKLVLICTGTQGEPMSALTRISNGTHKDFAANINDRVVITASVIPGNEKTVSSVVNSLLLLGADVYYEHDEHIHVSGHGSAEELKMMISLTKPKFFMPIHGEQKHLKAHGRIAESLKIKPSHIVIAENGDMLELTRKKFSKEGKIEISDIFIDGGARGDLTSNIIKDRQIMSTDGLVIASLVISNNMLVHPVTVDIRGLAVKNEDKLKNLLAAEINKKLTKLLQDGANGGTIKLKIKNVLKTHLHKSIRRFPLIEVKVLEV